MPAKGSTRSATTVPSATAPHDHADDQRCAPPCPAYHLTEANGVTFTAAPVSHEGLEAALVAFQREMPRVPKGNTARIPGKDGKGGYSYQYADLGDVSEAATPLLVKHGLAFTCLPTRTESGSYELQGVLLHTGGQRLAGALPIQGRTAQEIGSSITYGRRYLLGCMTGIITDEDEDGGLADQADGPVRDQVPEPTYTAAQMRLRGVLGELTAAQESAIRGWWATSGLPGLALLSDEDVATVEGTIRGMFSPDPQ